MKLLQVGNWAVIHDPAHRSIYCCASECGTYEWEHATFHTAPSIHAGPVWRYSRWWWWRSLPQAFRAAVRWAENRGVAADVELQALIQEARDRQEIQKIVGEL